MSNLDLNALQQQANSSGLFGKLMAILNSPFAYLKEILQHNGVASTKRTIMFVSAVVLCVCLVGLTGAIMYVLIKNPKDHKIDGNIALLYSALTVPIAGLAGTAYIKKNEAPGSPTGTNKPAAPNTTTTLQG